MGLHYTSVPGGTLKQKIQSIYAMSIDALATLCETNGFQITLTSENGILCIPHSFIYFCFPITETVDGIHWGFVGDSKKVKEFAEMIRFNTESFPETNSLVVQGARTVFENLSQD